MEAPRVVAVFNTSEDTTDLLRLWLEMAGYVVVTAFTNKIRDGKTDLEALMRQHRPRVVVYDVALPYDANWRFFQNVRRSPAAEGVRFVLTTTNAARVIEAAGPEAAGILEIVGKPYDARRLDELIAEAFRELDGGGPRQA
jgi:CheY-like chemotaxis protein